MSDLRNDTTYYPTGLDTFTELENGVDRQNSVVINRIVSAILAIEAELGLSPSGSQSSLLDRLAICFGANGGIRSGTSFPVSPIDGQLFRRTDYTPPKVYYYNLATTSWNIFTMVAEQLQGLVCSKTPTTNTIPLGDTAGRLQDGWIASTTVAGTPYARIKADGSGLISSSWVSSFTSAEQTISMAGFLTIPHGLGAVPSHVACQLVCKSGELGYSTGDVLNITCEANDGDNLQYTGMCMGFDATNIYVQYGNYNGGGGNNTMCPPRKDTGASARATNANWRLVVRAWG